MIVTVALRNLLYDRLRLLATLAGVAFSVILMAGQTAIYVGASRTITTMIDRSRADLWIMPLGSQSFEDGLPLLTEFDRQGALSTPGVESATPVVSSFTDWLSSAGNSSSIVLVGSDSASVGPEPPLSQGANDEPLSPRSVVIDRRYVDDLGVTGIGDLAGIGGYRIRVGALSAGVRSFTQSPYVFARPEQARRYLGIPADSTTFLLVRVGASKSLRRVQTALAARLSNVEVLTADEFRKRSLDRWLMQTGAGQALIIGTILGAVVGTVIIAQTINTCVRDHLSEFALLRSMGSSISYVQSIVLVQALAIAAAGAAIGLSLLLPLVPLSQDSPLLLMLTPQLILLIIIATFGISVLSSVGAVTKVRKLDPAVLFK
jgi:putative ABC transport system permease protein